MKNINKSASFYALAAYTSWGFFPLFWYLFHSVNSMAVLAQRIIWTFVAYGLFIILLKLPKQKLEPKNWFGFFMAAIFIGTNWYMYIYAVNSGYVIESSLGYFINPLVNILMGFLILREKLSKKAWTAVALATIGVVVLSLRTERVPWIALGLAFTFDSYGLVRKVNKVPATISSLYETLLLIPFGIWGTIYFNNQSAYDWSPYWIVMYFLSGIVTAVPLIFFAKAAQGMPLSSLGFFQYIAPTLQFLCGLIFFKEVFTIHHFFGFLFIWLALAIFFIDNYKKQS